MRTSEIDQIALNVDLNEMIILAPVPVQFPYYLEFCYVAFLFMVFDFCSLWRLTVMKIYSQN